MLTTRKSKLTLIEFKVDELCEFCGYPDALRRKVENTFRDRAQGTFLWVGIVAQELRKYEAVEVETVLDTFPPGLEELYARLLLQIEPHRDICARILSWVVMVIRPLTVSELSVAFNVRPTTIFSADAVMRQHVTSCGHFLTLKGDEVNLIHQSAKDYLLRSTCELTPDLELFRVKKDVANLQITRRCLSYLQSGIFEEETTYFKDYTRDSGEKNKLRRSRRKDISSHSYPPFPSYAALHWPEHTRFLHRSEDIFQTSYPFYNENSTARMAWWRDWG